MNDQLDATIEFGIEQAKKRVAESPTESPATDLLIVLVAQVRDALWERRTWRRRAVAILPGVGFGAGIWSLVAAALKTIG